MEIKNNRLLDTIIKTHSDIHDISKAIELYKNRNNQKIDNLQNNDINFYKDQGTDVIHDVHEHILKILIEIFKKYIPFKEGIVYEDIDFEDVQLSSLKKVDLIADIEKYFSGVPSTLLFEYNSIREIADYIVENHKDLLEKKYGMAYKDKAVSLKKHDAVSNDRLDDIKDIAIIGISGKFPFADSIDEFWSNLSEGKNCISEIPESRWSIEEFYSPDNLSDKSYSKWGGFIHNIDLFDASFFHISPKEAELMDPQVRLFLEISSDLLDDAGYTPETVNKNTGVFVGISSNDYSVYANQAALHGQSQYRVTDYYHTANRVSYFFDLKGPSMSIDTACSSSGTALHIAYESLLRKECDAAIVGGCNLFLCPSRYVQFSQMSLLSRGEQTKPFDAEADGMVFGEGIAAVMLKPLSEAKSDNDKIYGIIKGSFINNSGRTQGYMTPDPQAQASLIQKAFDKTGIDPITVSYIETQGTGTLLGDSIEIRAIKEGFHKSYKKDNGKIPENICALGTVKPNIGYLESAATLASLIKVILQLKYKILLPIVHHKTLNPMISLKETPFYIQKERTDWNPNGRDIRRACINSIGAGGANSFIIIEEFKEENNISIAPDDENIFALSARNKNVLNEYLEIMTQYVRENKSYVSENFVSFLYTLQRGRTHFKERIGIICTGYDDLVEKLDHYILYGNKNSQSIFTRNNNDSTIITKSKNENDTDNQTLDKKEIVNNWIHGENINWKILYRKNIPKLISLPHYPFQKQRYWIDSTILPIKDKEIIFKNNCIKEKFNFKADQYGAFVILGGINKISLNISKFLAEKYNATLLIIGEKKPDDFQKESLERLMNEYACELYYYVINKDNSIIDFLLHALKEHNKIQAIIFDNFIEYPHIESNLSLINDIIMRRLTSNIFFYDEKRSDNLNNNIVLNILLSRLQNVNSTNPYNIILGYIRNNINDAEIFKGNYEPLRFDDMRKNNIIINSENIRTDYEDIAIIGMSGKFPGAKNINEFWDVLYNAKETISFFTDEEILEESHVPNDIIKKRNYIKAQGIIEDAEFFDANFFNINPGEAELLDPQQRIALECAYHAMEDAGYCPGDKDHSIGVYLSSFYNTYLKRSLNINDYSDNSSQMMIEHFASDLDYAATRIGYKLNLKGPCITIQTACSSSLVGLHLACRSLISRDCDMALVGGTSITFPQKTGYLYEEGFMVSNDGHCRSFEKSSTGTAPGNGVCFIMIKLLKDAMRDGDTIHAVIKGSAINNDGDDKVGFTAPSVFGQSDVIRKAVEASKINPETITYIEAHGTGTKLGDPIEISALTSVYNEYTNKKGYCAIGSLKSNMGHLNSAAGVAGLAKTVLCLKHKMLVPSLHFKEPNPEIDFKNSPFFVNTMLREWHNDDHPLRAAVSSFGVGGTNAHIILEQAPVIKKQMQIELDYYPIPISAKTDTALKTKIMELTDWIHNNKSNYTIGDLSFTLCVGRNHFKYRSIFLVRDYDDLIKKIELFEYEEIKRDFSSENSIREIENILKNNNTITKEKYFEYFKQFCKAYESGININWNLIFNTRHNRIPIPPYPFERKKYSIYEKNNLTDKINNKDQQKISILHPLIDSNESTLFEQYFIKKLNIKEFFLRDHVFNGTSIVPGVVMLEMSRIAGFLSNMKTKVTKLSEIMFVKPILVTENDVSIKISISPAHDCIGFEIKDEQDNNTIYCSGKISYEDIPQDDYAQLIDIDTIKNKCNDIISGTDCYDMFMNNGFKYGPTFRSIKEIQYNSHEALAYIELPDESNDSFNNFIIHPSIMDGALQSCIGVTLHKTIDAMRLPFYIDEIILLKKLEKKCYSYITVNQSKIEKVNEYTIKILDIQGNVLMDIKKYCDRELN